MKLHSLYFSEKTTLRVHNELVAVKAFQIVVWVSISNDESAAWEPRIPKIPAILDIGTTHNFFLTKEHLARWAGIHAASLRKLGHIRVEGAAPQRQPLASHEWGTFQTQD